MKLSAPIYQLKHHAKTIARDEAIPLHEALDRIAAAEGFDSWSLLAHRANTRSPAAKLFAQLLPGDLLLLAARPKQGKTMFAFELVAQAINRGNHGAVFSFDFTHSQLSERLLSIDESLVEKQDRLVLDASDNISADYIISKLNQTPPSTLVVIDYLQALDHSRANPELAAQIQTLRVFAKTQGITIVCISQVSRGFDSSANSFPDQTDVHLPNPLDLGLFTKTCFMSAAGVQVLT